MVCKKFSDCIIVEVNLLEEFLCALMNKRKAEELVGSYDVR